MSRIFWLCCFGLNVFSISVWCQTVGVSGNSTINQCETNSYTISITNDSGNVMTNLVVTAELLNLTGFSYESGTTSMDVNGGGAFCTSNPTPFGTDLIWNIDASCPGPFTLNNGETLNVSFNLSTDCSAVSGFMNTQLDYQISGTPLTNNTGVLNIQVKPGAVSIKKTLNVIPQVFGGNATWTLTVENTGFGAIKNVEVTDLMGAGLAYVSSTQNGNNAGQTTTWTSNEYAALGSMDPGDILTMDITAQVIACDNLDCEADVRFGCNPSPAATCFNTAVDGGTARAAVQRIVRTPDLVNSPRDINFTYCDDTQSVSFTITNIGDGLAYNVYSIVDFTGFTVSNVSAGAVYNVGLTRFELSDPIPASGGTYDLSFDLTYNAWCGGSFPSGGLLWQKLYEDECGQQFYPPVELSSINAAASSSSLSVSKTGAPSQIEIGDPITYTITSSYSGQINCGSPSGSTGDITVVDTLPDGFTVSLPLSDGGIWTPGGDGTGGTIEWSYAPPATLSTTITVQSPLVADCETYCNTVFNNSVTATGVDCCGCALNASDSQTTAIECAEGVTSDKTSSSPTERCTDTTYSNTYVFDGGSSVLLSDLIFTEKAELQQVFDGNLSILLDGNPVGGVVSTDTTPGGTYALDFSGAAATPLAGSTLVISYDLTATVNTLVACSDNTFYSWSSLDMGPSGSSCLGDGIIHEVTQVSLGSPSMSLSIGGLGQIYNTCETKTITLTFTQTSDFNPKDVKLVLSGLNYYVVTPGAVVCGGSVAPVSCTPVIDGSGDYVWTFNDGFAANGANAVLTLDVQKRCTGGGALTATGYYDDACTDDATADELCSVVATETPALLLKGDLLIEKTPETYYAITDQVQWEIYVTNRGTGTAYNVWVDDVLGSGLVYEHGVNPVVVSGDNAGVTINDSLDHNDGAINGASVEINSIAAGERRQITFIAKQIDCLNLTNGVTANWGCIGVECQTDVSDSSIVSIPAPNLINSNIITPPDGLDACENPTGYITLRNAGQVYTYNLQVTETLPDDLTYSSGSTRWRLNGGAWNGPNVIYNPSPTTSPLIWTSAEIPALASAAPGDTIEIEFGMISDCPFSGGDITVTTQYKNPCDDPFNTATNTFSIVLNQPDIVVSKTRANDPIGCNEAIQWIISVENISGYTLPVIWVEDTMDAAFTFASALGDVTYGSDNGNRVGQVITWELVDVPNGATATIILNATSDSAPCSPDLDNTLRAYWGCGVVDGLSSTKPGLTGSPCLTSNGVEYVRTETREPALDFIGALGISFSPSDINTCNDTTKVRVEVENVGPTDALDLDLVIRLPIGLTYDTGTAESAQGVDDIIGLGATGDPAISPGAGGTQILTFYDIGDKGSNLSNLLQAAGGNDTLVLAFDVSSTCYEGDPLGVDLYYYDCCSNTQYSTSSSAHPTFNPPAEIGISMTPSTQIVVPGQNASWTITLTNSGAGDATNFVLTDQLGNGFSSPSDTSGLPGSWAANLRTWTIPNIAANGGTWSVDIQAQVGTGFLLSTVEGTASEESCTGAACAASPPCTAKHFCTEYAYVAGFVMTKSVNKDPANVGEELTYTLAATFSNTEQFQNVTIRDSLPGYVESITPTAGGSNDMGAPIVAAFVEDGSSQTLTWSPADFNGNALLDYSLSARIRNDAGEDDVISGLNLTNTLTVVGGFDIDFGAGAGVQHFAPPSVTDSTIVTEPALTITKDITPATGDAGDTVTVTLVVENTGDGTAFEVNVTDMVNDQNDDGAPDVVIFDTTNIVESASVGTPTPAGWTFTLDNSGANNVAVNYTTSGSGDIPAGETRTFVFDVVLTTNIVAGTAYLNTAHTTGHSLNETDSEFNDGTYDRQPTAEGSDTLTAKSLGAPVKTLTATSEDGTDTGDANIMSNPPVAIGEVVSVQMIFTLPEGTTENVLLVDRLTNVSSTAWGAFVAGSATLTRSTTALSSSTDPDSINTEPAGSPQTLTDGNMVTTVGATYTTIELSLGNVTNTDTNNATNETYTLSFDIVVLNNTVTNAGTTLTDIGRIRYQPSGGGDQFVNSSSVNIHVAEPTPLIDKAVSPTLGDAGDTIHFTLTLENSASGGNAASAYDWSVTDAVPAYFDTIQNLAFDPGTTGAVIGGSFTGNTLNATIDQLDPGESITIEFDAVLVQGVNFGQVITNAASFTTTSLPGLKGTGDATPGASGDSDGERNGSGGVNDYASSDSANVTINTPTISKDSLNPQSYYAIEEQPQFEIQTGVPEATNNDFLITDTLPEGLAFVAGTLTVAVPSAASSSNGAMNEANNPAFFFYDSGTRVLTFDFGTLTTPNAGNIVISYETSIENIIENQDGDILTNSVQLDYEDPTNAAATITIGPVDNATPVRVGEPNLGLSKTITSGSVGLDAGDTVSWQVDAINSGNTTACQLVWQDILPDGLFNISGAALTISGGNVYLNGTTTAPVNGDFSISTTANTNDTLALPSLEVAPGATLRVTFDSILMDSVQPSDVLNNTVTFSYTSLPGGGRDNSTLPGPVDDDDDSDLNNYQETASQSLTVDAGISIDKTIPSMVSTYSIGELVTYRIQIDIIDGVTPDLHLYDFLPSGLTYVSHDISVGQVGIVIGNGSYDTRLGAGQEVHFSFGDVTNPAAAGTSDFLAIEITARVDNILLNQDGTILSNGEDADSADVYLTYGAGPIQIDFDEDGNAGNGNQGIPVTVVEPDLTISKTVDVSTQALGDLVTYTMTVTHTGGSTSDAFDVSIVDTLPVGLTYVTGSCTLPPADVSAVGQILTFSKASFTIAAPDNGTWSFTYQARVDLDVTVNQTLTNDARLTWASITGATGAADHGRNGDDGVGLLNDYVGNDNADVTTDTPALIDAQKTVALVVDGGISGQVDPGDTLEYTITLTNGVNPVTNVIFSDSIPGNATYVVASLSSSDGTIDDSGDPLLVNVGSMAGSAVVTIVFRVTVDPGTPQGTVISNQGSVDSDQTVPEPTDEDGVDENGDQPTDVTVGGPPAVVNALYVHKQVLWITDADLSGDVSPGDTLRYFLSIENRGDESLTTVEVTDTIPNGLTYVAATASIPNTPTNSITVVGSAVIITLPSLQHGLRETIAAQFDVTIDDPLVDFNGGTNDETFINQAETDSDQTDTSQSDGNGDPTDGNQPTRITAYDNNSGIPEVDVEKRWLLLNDNDGDGLVDPLDTLLYTIYVQNIGGADATDLRLADAIPANTTLIVGTVTTDHGVVVGEDPVDINIGKLVPGALVIIQFQVIVDGGTPDGTIIPNQATVTGDGGISEPSDDNGDDGDGKNPTLTPVDTGGGSGAGSPSGLTKALYATSEADSSGSNVFVGEVLTFRAAIQVPAGTTFETELTDTLPTEYTYISGTSRLARTFDTGLISSVDPGGVNSSATGVFVVLSDTSDLVVSGQVLSVFLGDLINSDSDVNAESFVWEYQVVVNNTAGTNSGDTPANSAGFSYQNGLGQIQNLTPINVTTTVLEPSLSISKTGQPGTMLNLGGDVTFTLTVTNPQTGTVAPGYDVNVSDTLPAIFTSMTVDSITPGAGVTGVTNNSSGTSIDIDVAVFPANGTLTIIVTGTAPSGLTNNTYTNTASMTWTSLPGTNGTGSATPGSPGDADGERTGSTVGSNDYSTSDTADTVVGGLALTKTILNPKTRYAIGDLVEYRVEIGLPQNVSIDNAIINDVLDEGLTYVTGSLTRNYPAGTSSSTNPVEFTRTDDDPSAGFETLELDLGTIANSNGSSAMITFEYDALVDNILGNQNNQTLDNNVTLDFDNPAGGAALQETDTSAITVGEPTLTLAKTITSATTNLQAGDTVSFQVVVGNTGTTTAFETVLTDVLPAGMENVTGITVTGTSGGAETPTFTNNGTDWSSSEFDVPVGGTVTITFDVALATSVIPGQTLQNSVSATFTSVDGTNSDERDGSDAGSNQGDGNLDNYNVTASSATITVDDPIQIDKNFHPDLTNTTYTLGEVFQYRLTIQILEGTVNDLVVTDTLPAGVLYQSTQVGFGHMGMTATTIPTGSQVGQTVTYDFGDVSNPANADATDDFITIDITAQIEDVPGNVDGTILGNNANVTFTGPSGSVTRDFDDDNVTGGIQPLDLTIVEPDVTITKTADDTTVTLGDVVTFTILLDHTVVSTADAFDLNIVDTLPAGLSYVTGSASIVPTSVVGQVLTFDIASLTLLDDNTSFTYQARVDAGTVVGTSLTNDADLTYYSQTGPNPERRSYTDTDSDTVTAIDDSFIEATKTVAIAVDGGTVGVADPGDTLEYSITLINTGANVTGVVFSDPIPVSTTYVAGSLVSSVGGADDSDPTNMVVTIGPMNTNDTITITFRVTIDGGVPAGTIISNQGEVDSNETVPEPTDEDGDDSNGDQPTDIPVGGPPSVTNALYTTKAVEWLVDADSSTDVTAGDTMRYHLVIMNLGDQELTNVTLTDTIPTGLTYVGASATISGGHTIGVAGSSLSISIGSLGVGGTVTAAFDVTIDVFVPTSATFVNQGATNSDQTDPGQTDGNGDPSDGYQPTQFMAVNGTVGLPALDLEKRWSLAVDVDGDGLVDPGDTLLYTLSLLNTGSAAALNTRISDPIPTNTTVVTGSVTTSQGIVVGEDPVDINLGDVDPGSLITMTFRVTVDGGTPDGTILENQATASGDNFSDEPSDDNGDDGDGKNPTLTPVDTGGGSSSGTPGGLQKTLHATSETGSNSTDVLIGEIATYRISIGMPVGTLQEVWLVDTLPTGLQYLSGTARLARTFETGMSSSQNPGGINSAATGTFIALADGSDVTFSGSDVELFLGDVINSDNDGNAETYTLEIQVLVENIAGNQAGGTLTNSATLRFNDQLGQGVSLSPVTHDLDIVEANIQVAKTASPTMMTTAGGDIAFTVVVTNPDTGNTGPAYDISIADILSAEWTALSIDSITPAGGVTGVTDNSAGTTVDITVDTFPVDGALTIVYTGTAPGVLSLGTLTNSASVGWTSTPGNQGTGNGIPGNSGDPDGERNSSGGVNDYTTSDTADVEIGDTNITKTILNPQTRYAIGDIVNYQIEIPLPATAALGNTTVEDILDEGLTYQTGTLAFVWDSTTSSLGPADFTRTNDAPAAGQETLTLDLGIFSNPTSSTKTLVLTYDALVDNILANQDGQSLANNVSLTYDDPGGGSPITQSDTTSITLGEPHLALSKTLASPAVGLDAGDTVDFQVEVSNDGTTTAFDVILSDTLPAGLENITSLVVSSVAGGAETPTFTNNGTDWSSSAFDLPVSASVTITFTVELSNTVIPGQTLQNSVQATFTSRDGNDPNQRDGSTVGSDQDDDSDLDNYNETDSAAAFTVADPIALNKEFYPDVTHTTYTIGETFQYRLVVSLIEGATNSLVVTDVLPDGVRFDSASTGVGNLGMSLQFNDPPVEVGQSLTFTYGTVTNPANGNTNDDFLTIDITVIVEDVIGNVDGTILSNNASLSFDGPGGSETRDFDSDSGTPGIQGLDLTIVEPVVDIIKTVTPTLRSQGDLVTFTILLDHLPSSNADAYDLQVVDTLPSGLTYLNGSANVTPAIAGQVLTFDIAALTLIDDQTTITYQARVDLDVLNGAVLTNTANLSYSTQPGANPDERTYTDSDTATVTVAEVTVIDAQKTVAIAVDGGTLNQVDVGDTLEYTITIVNNGAPATNVVFTDPLPNNSTYVAASLSAPGAISIDDSGDPLIVTIGNMADGSSFTITFQVTVDAGTPAGTIIRNQGSVDSDQTVPEQTDEDGVDGNGDQPTDVTVGGPPTLTNALYVHKTVELLTDMDSSGDVTPGDVLRYSFYIYNYGDGPLTHVEVTDTIPNGLTYIAASEMTTIGSISVTAPNLTITIPSLSPQLRAPAVASVDVTVDGPPLFDTDASPNTETFVNQANTNSDQTDPGFSDGNGDPSDGNQPTEITAVDGVPGSPILDVEKRWSLAIDADGDGLVDPGDTIEYRVWLINEGSAAAENVFLEDTIPADTTLAAGSATTSQGVVVTEDPVNVNIGDIDPGATVTVTFRVTVDLTTPDGTIIPNQATASGDNFPDEPSDDNGDDSDGKNPTLTPVDTDGGSSSGTPGGLTKGIVSTTEPGSTGSNVLIGEIATFRVGVTLPVGTLREVTIVDTLPTGLTYFSNSARLARTFDTGLVSSQDPGGINGAVADTFIPLTDGSDIILMGQDIELFLGDIINSDNDGNDEIYTLELRVLVENIAGNQEGTVRTNQATLQYLDGLGQPQTLTPVTQAITVIEPSLMISKSALPTMLTTLGGDVTFTVVVTNPNGANIGPAYNAIVSDVLDPVWTNLVVNSAVPAGGVSGVTDLTAGTTLSVSVDVFPVDGSLTITFTASAPGPITPGTLTNTANVAWTSTPGPNGSTGEIPGSPGDADGERTGSGGVNDYLSSDTADVVVGDTNITKTILNPKARYAIGDFVDYQVQISVPPAASLANSVIEDILEEGLTYQSGLTIDLDGMTSSNNPLDFLRTNDFPAVGQETLTLDLGTFANPTATVRTLTLTYSVLVDNILLNQEGHNLSNGVTLTYDNPGGGSAISQSDSQSVIVGEPHLTLAKAILSAVTNLDAGDPIDFQIDLGNDGTTTAFDVVVTDTLPAGLENVTSLTVSSATGGAETPTFTYNGTDWSTSAFDIPVGGEVTITYTAYLSNTVIPGQSIQNTVEASFTSQDGADSNERDGSTSNSDQDDDSDLNNYNESDSAPVITVGDSIAINKEFYPNTSHTNYTIGDSVGYRITVSLNEGTVDDLIVVDSLPAGLRFESSVVGSGNLGITNGYSGTPTIVGQDISFELNQVVNPANGNTTDDYLTFDITATVENVPGNQDGIYLENNASLTFTGPGGTETRDFDSDSSTPGIQGLELLVVEPELQLLKSVVPVDVWPGTQVTYTLTVDHTDNSHVDAYDIVIVDTLPADITYVPGSASLAPTSVVGQVITFTLPVLTLFDDQFSITYDGLVDVNAALGVPLQNTAIGTFTTQPGVHPDERGGDDGVGGLNDLETNPADAEVIPTRPVVTAQKVDALFLDSNGDGVASPGEVLEYTVTIVNSGNDSANNVMFTDTPDTHTSLVAGSITTTQGTVTGGQAGTPPVVVDIGTLLAMTTVTITFQVQIDEPLDPTVSVLSNQGILSSNELPDIPTDDPDDPTGDDDPTDTPVYQADLGVTKSDDPDPIALGGGDVTYSIVIENFGPSDATQVVATDSLPAEFTYVASTTSAGSVTYDSLNHLVIFDVGDLANGAQVLGSITVTPTDEGIFTNTISVDALQYDPNPDNDTDIEDTTVVEGVDLSLVKTVNNPTPDYQEVVTFTIRITNDGPSTATGITVTDTWPPALVYVSHSTTSGSYDPGSGLWTLASMAANTSEDLLIQARVNGLGTQVNTVEIMEVNEVDLDSTPGNGDPAEDDISTVELVVNDTLDLALRKTVIAENPFPGSIVYYRIEVENYGPSPAEGTVVTDRLPSEIEYIDSIATQGSYNPQSGEWFIGHMDPGGVHFLNIHCRIRTDTPIGADILNFASVTSDLVELDITNNDDGVSITTLAGVPTLQEWGMILFVFLMAGAAIAIRRQKTS